MNTLKDLLLIVIVTPILLIITDCPKCGDDRIRLCRCEKCGYHPFLKMKSHLKKAPGVVMDKLLKFISDYFFEPLIWLASPKCRICGEILITTYDPYDTLGLAPTESCPECDCQEAPTI